MNQMKKKKNQFTFALSIDVHQPHSHETNDVSLPRQFRLDD
jgi:hypothetical protein